MADEPPTDDTALGTQSAALEVGLRVFRQYVLKRFLGRGPLGSAWLVVHEGIGRELAMRFVPEAWLREERVMSRLREAVVRLLEITHPGLVGILDFVRDAQAAAIVSKFVDAETVLDAKARRPERCFDVDVLQPWLGQVCEALDFAWRQHQATHGDLTPGNLLVTTTGEMKIADFGLARNLVDLEAPSGGPLLAVNLAHASPERARGAAVTVADDVYGLGSTLYDMLTSRAPFFRGNVRWQLESVVPPRMAERRAELSIVASPIPPEWEEVIAACLAKLPEDRPRSVREVGERLGVLAPLPAQERVPQAVVLPRPAETVVGLRLPPIVPPGPVPEFPTTIPTAPMEPPTMIGATIALEAATPETPAEAVETPAPEAEPQWGEAAPATVDESLDLEATISELPPPEPPGEPVTQPVPVEDLAATMIGAPMGEPPAPAGSTLAEEDLFATIAAAPEPAASAEGPGAGRNEPASSKPAFVPPPGLTPSADDADATLAAEEPLPRPAEPPAPVPDLHATVAEAPPRAATAPRAAAAQSPAPTPSPAVPEVPRNLEESVTLPSAVRHPQAPAEPAAAAVPPPMPAPASQPAKTAAAPAQPTPTPALHPSSPPPPPPARRGTWWWWIAAPIALVAVAIIGGNLGRHERVAGEPTPAPATPLAEPATPVPVEPTPAPATPSPTPAPPAGQPVTASDLGRYAETGRIAEPLLLTGSFRVSTSTPAAGAQPGSAVMRPSDPALSGKVRVMTLFAPGTPVPTEGGTVSIAPDSRYFVKEVRRGADGQLNVQVEQR